MMAEETPNPEVSIIVPVFNVESYLPRCVDSIINQDFSSYEVLLIDDGSTDSSGQIAEAYSQWHDRVECFHKANGGLSDARNFGIDLARGRYYAFIDSDDFISPCYISAMHSVAIRHDADIVVCGYKSVTEEEPLALKTDPSTSEIKTGDEALKSIFVNRSIIDVVAWNKLYKAELFSKGVRYPVGKINEDVWTTYKLYSLSNRVAYIDDALYGYYQRNGSIIHSFSNASLEVSEVASCVREWLGIRAEEYRNEIDWFDLRLAYRTLCRILDHGSTSELKTDYSRLSKKISLGSLMDNPYGSAREKALMWLTARAPKLVSTLRSLRH